MFEVAKVCEADRHILSTLANHLRHAAESSHHTAPDVAVVDLEVALTEEKNAMVCHSIMGRCFRVMGLSGGQL